MRRTALLTLCLCLLLSLAAFAQAGKPSDRDAVIQSAMSAALPSISANATIMDWENNVIREGTNGWTCFPDMFCTEPSSYGRFQALAHKGAEATMKEQQPVG